MFYRFKLYLKELEKRCTEQFEFWKYMEYNQSYCILKSWIFGIFLTRFWQFSVSYSIKSWHRNFKNFLTFRCNFLKNQVIFLKFSSLN
jgi:hypothetical protein